VGIKDVFSRKKGKPDPQSEARKAAEAARRKTDEATIQVKVGGPPANPGVASQQQDPTIVASPVQRPMPQARPPAPSPSPERREADATVVMPPSNEPQTATPAATPSEPVPQARPSVAQERDEATVVAAAASAPIPQKPVATPFAPQPAVQGSPSTTPVAQKSTPSATQPETPNQTPAASPAVSTPVSSGDATLYAAPDAEAGNEIAGVLVGLFGEAKGQIFSVPEGQCTLGRSETCEIHVLDAKVSREHAAITCANGNVEVRALNERNPIVVNDGDSAETQSVADGDKIQFGNAGASIFRFRTIDGL
jgi:hypothetical protein